MLSRSIYSATSMSQSFRYNNRKNVNDQDRLELAMRNVADKRLTYKQLPGVGAATSH
jgi:hypothetical protein